MCGGSIISDEPIVKRKGKLTTQEFWAELDTISQFWGFNCSTNDARAQPKESAKKPSPPSKGQRPWGKWAAEIRDPSKGGQSLGSERFNTADASRKEPTTKPPSVSVGDKAKAQLSGAMTIHHQPPPTTTNKRGYASAPSRKLSRAAVNDGGFVKSGSAPYYPVTSGAD
ncbi:ethylene-responsive transcription factor rap2-3 [Phtheirospermum japonicum]|uniref:Ethylene-responsive transcription factor rap2-3 n=1 Tax=Phtheirospermum japonicum TaxID=374723 RepID=A0A830D8A8_9LAMI|nr:ethylene-responsive transcription factor rap2-3 [Phtheirospermum japonicum]